MEPGLVANALAWSWSIQSLTLHSHDHDTSAGVPRWFRSRSIELTSLVHVKFHCAVI